STGLSVETTTPKKKNKKKDVTKAPTETFREDGTAAKPAASQAATALQSAPAPTPSIPVPATAPATEKQGKKKKDKKPKTNVPTQAKPATPSTPEVPSSQAVQPSQPTPTPVPKATQTPRPKPTSNATTSDPQTSIAKNGSHGALWTESCSFYLSLSPIALAYPLEGLCAEHLSPLLLTYFRPLRGVVLSYSNPRFGKSSSGTEEGESEDEPVLADTIDQYATSFVWVTADFYLFRPRKGLWLDGHVNLPNESYLGLLLWNLIPVTVKREHLPRDWRWVDGAGRIEDGDGDEEMVDVDVHVGVNGAGTGKDNLNDTNAFGCWANGDGEEVTGFVTFRVRDWDTAGAGEGGIISLVGTLLGDEELREVEEEERDMMAAREGQTLRRGRPPAPQMSRAVGTNAR
ncbi:hypothetical protein LTS18_014567, partial [Coniosporium uncinatum]